MKIPKKSNCLMNLFFAIACVLIVSAIFFFSSDTFTEWRWRQEAKKSPDKYAVCKGRCQKLKPKKIIMNNGVCDEDYYKEIYYLLSLKR